ncbi:MAG TPA: glycoside hydrolase family 2 TIM barrel-domain containing protein, partial [Capsulimonadaceae bacterium]|nr:glycoside hydrolase family 2 TIM barrel-domain containing protein [Capsulimonadaceae bacterium]
MDSDWRFFLVKPAGAVSGTPITDWTYQATARRRGFGRPSVPQDTSGWQKAAIGQDVFNNSPGAAWFAADLGSGPPAPRGFSRILHFESVDDNAIVFVNGTRLVSHNGWNDPFDVPLDKVWNPTGPNRVMVMVVNTGGAGGIMRPPALQITKPVSYPSYAHPTYSDTSWRIVHLPHDYVVEGSVSPGFDTGHGSLATYPAWYRKTFILPASDKGKSIWIDFDGIYRDSQIWLNGHYLGEHKSGYAPFRYDIGTTANYGGRNVLAISVKSEPFEGWWYEGGGIYRHVWLNVADPVHVAPWGTYVTSSLPEPKPGQPVQAATLTIQTSLVNTGPAQACRLISTVLDDQGHTLGTIAAHVALGSGANATKVQTLAVAHPRLWSPDSPHMYSLRTSLMRGGKVFDSVETPFGIRTIRYDPNLGFFLNGKPVKIKGTCNHQDLAGVGIGVPDSLEYWRVAQLKKMGSNAWRTAHNPPTASLLDACDKLGMLVMDENRHLGDTWDAKSNADTPYSDLSDLNNMILRDRNHPSIIMWSLCNEEGIQSTPAGARIFSAMKQRVLQFDKTRPITCAMNGGWGQGITLVEDLQGVNYSPREYDSFHKSFPNMPLYGSETSSEVGDRGIYENDSQKAYVSAYDSNPVPWGQTASGAWEPIATRPFVAGGFVWTGFDYKGETTPYGWPDVNSHFGILDIAGFPKDNYYWYQAWWGDKPVVHIFPHWNWKGKEGQPIDVWCYSNAASVELILNGKSLGAKPMPAYGHTDWTVDYQPGTLVARGYDSGGKLIGTDTVATTGAPEALRITTDHTTLTADGEDAA